MSESSILRIRFDWWGCQVSNPCGRHVSSTFSGHPETWGPRPNQSVASRAAPAAMSRFTTVRWPDSAARCSGVYQPRPCGIEGAFSRKVNKQVTTSVFGWKDEQKKDGAQLISGCVFRFPLSCLFPVGRVNPSQRAEGEGRGRPQKRVQVLKTFRISTECPTTYNCFKAVV